MNKKNKNELEQQEKTIRKSLALVFIPIFIVLISISLIQNDSEIYLEKKYKNIQNTSYSGKITSLLPEKGNGRDRSILIDNKWGNYIVVLGFRRHQGFYNRESITTTDLYGKTVSLKWHEISLISFNSLTSNILLHSKDGQKLKVHMHLKGAKNIVQKLKNMDVPAKNQAVPHYKA